MTTGENPPHVVISQTWLRTSLPGSGDDAAPDGDAVVARYIELIAEFDPWQRSQPGFLSRRLIRSLDDPRHLIHIREFRSIDDYDAMTQHTAYADHIGALSALVDPSAYPDGAVPKEFGEVLFDSPGTGE